MLKWLKAFGVAAILSLPWALPVSASHIGNQTVVTNTTDQLLNAVGETTSTLTADPFELMSVFVSGTYAAGNTVVLQKEVGSPGSGAFETVATVTTGTANERIEFQFTNGPNTNGYRLKMTVTGTGAVVAYLTDWPTTAVNWRDTSHYLTQVVDFDDFENTDEEASTTVVDVETYLSTTDGGDTGTIAAHVAAIREGGVLIVGNATDESWTCMSYIVAANFASLVSDGVMAWETRLTFTDDDGTAATGLNNVICATNDDDWYDIASEAVTALAANADSAAWVQDAAATDVTTWQTLSAHTDVEGANALSVPGPTHTPAAYAVYRIEIDSAGNAYWYYNGVLRHAEPLAVNTTAELIPFVAVSGNGGGTVNVNLDYWMFVRPRPTDVSS